MHIVAPDAKGSRCPAAKTIGQRRGPRRAELGLPGPRLSLTTPGLFLRPERIRRLRARTTSIGEQKR